MSEVSKNELKYQNSVSFPNNNSGEISPADLRNFNVELIDSTVNQTLYTADSSSFDGRLDSAESSITNINAYTASTSQRLDSIEQTTASLEDSVNQLEVASSSFEDKFDVIASQSGTWNAGAQDLTPLNNFTASQEIINSNLHAFTASQELLDGTYATTGSNTFQGNQTINGTLYGNDILLDDPGANSTILLNPNYFSEFKGGVFQWREGNEQSYINVAEKDAYILINGWSGSYDEALFLAVNSNGVSFQDWNGSYTPTTWLNIAQKQGNPSFKRTIEVTGSVEIQNTLTASLQEGYALVGNSSGITVAVSTASWDSHTDIIPLNQFTASQENLNLTFATTGSNTFQGNQTINGTIYGNDILLDDPGANSTILLNSNYFSEYKGGLLQWKEGNEEAVLNLAEKSAYILLNGWSSSYDNALFISSDERGTVFGDWSLPSYTQTPWMQVVQQGTPQMLRGLQVTGSLSASGSFASKVSVPGNESQNDWFNFAPFTGDNGTTYQYASVGLQQYVSSGIHHAFMVELANSNFQKYTSLAIGEGYGNITIGTGADYDFDKIEIKDNGDNTSTATIKADTIIHTGNTQNQGNVLVTGSAQISGSFGTKVSVPGANSQNDWFNFAPFTGNNGTTYSYASVGLQEYASTGINHAFMVELANASFEKYTSLAVGEGYANFTIGTGTGYDFDNISIVDNGNNTSTAQIKADSIINRGAVEVTGSVNGNVQGLSITSQTASIDFNTGNFFTLNLASGTDTHVVATNVNPGQTVNLKVVQDATSAGTISFPSSFKFPEVAPYSASVVTNSIDVITFITFDDTSSIYSAAVKRLV